MSPKYSAVTLTLLSMMTVSFSLRAQLSEEIVVYASKQPGNAQRQPVAASVIDESMLHVAGIQSMFELQSLAPSLTLAKGTSANSLAFGIRGISTNSVNAALEPSVGFYVDGVSRARQGAMANSFVDIARVEILRGPQGTLFGRNTSAGTVSISTVPADQEGGFFALGGGSDDRVEFSGAASFQAIEDVLAFRLSGFHSDGDGDVDDLHFGDNALNDRNRWGLRLQSLYTPSDSIRLRIIADGSGLDENCCAVGSWKNNLYAQELPPGAPQKSGTDSDVLRLGGTVISQEDFFNRAVALDTLSESSNDEAGLSLQLDWTMGRVVLTSITAYRTYQLDDRGDSDFTDLAALYARYDLEQSQFSQEFRLSGKEGIFSYVGGLYFFDNEVDTDVRLTTGKDLTGLLSLPDSAFPTNSSAVSVSSQDNLAFAAFGQTDARLNEVLTLTGGARWTREQKELVNLFYEDASDALDFVSPGWGFWLLPSLAPRADVNEEMDENQWTSTLKLSWLATQSSLFYLSWSTGYKAGGINTSRIDERLDPVFDSQNTVTWEAGLKMEVPDNSLRFNIASHFTETEDLQVESYQDIGFTLQNAGESRTYGGELDLLWQPVDALSLTASYAYNHSELRDFDNGTCWVATPWHTDRPDPGSNADGSCNRSGGVLPGNAEHSGVVTSQWMFNLGREWQGILYGEYSYTDKRMTELNNDPLKWDGGYGLFNLRASLLHLPWQTMVTVWGRNITDTEYTLTIQDAPLQDGRLLATYGEPRSWGLMIRRDF